MRATRDRGQRHTCMRRSAACRPSFVSTFSNTGGSGTTSGFLTLGVFGDGSALVPPAVTTAFTFAFFFEGVETVRPLASVTAPPADNEGLALFFGFGVTATFVAPSLCFSPGGGGGFFAFFLGLSKAELSPLKLTFGIFRCVFSLLVSFFAKTTAPSPSIAELSLGLPLPLTCFALLDLGDPATRCPPPLTKTDLDLEPGVLLEMVTTGRISSISDKSESSNNPNASASGRGRAGVEDTVGAGAVLEGIGREMTSDRRDGRTPSGSSPFFFRPERCGSATHWTTSRIRDGHNDVWQISLQHGQVHSYPFSLPIALASILYRR